MRMCSLRDHNTSVITATHNNIQWPWFFTSTLTLSMWPSKLAMKGFEKILSILAAFNAQFLSLARENGCIRGFKLQEVGVASPGHNGRCSAGACCSTDIFYMWQEIDIYKTMRNKGLHDPRRECLTEQKFGRRNCIWTKPNKQSHVGCGWVCFVLSYLSLPVKWTITSLN